MKFSQPDGPFCQSCGMPLEGVDDYGTDTDGSKNNEYCCYCFQKGKFIEPNISMDEMIEKVTKYMVAQMKMMEFQAEKTVEKFIPKLKRWQGK
ncbi:MAG: zinc ribbon domain-containing protein [bacterium]